MDTVPEYYTTDLSFKDLVANIYKAPPQPPYSVNLEFLDEINKEDIKKYLSYFVMEGAKTKYHKELAQLLPQEIETLREYLQSIGWDVEFKVETQMKKISDIDEKYLPNKSSFNLNTEVPVNVFMIDFMPCDIKKAQYVAGKPL